MKTKLIYICLSLLLFVYSCKEEYDPPSTAMPKPLLVVEGNLDPSGPVSIRLTKTVSLDKKNTVEAENNAQLVVEGKDNSTRNLFFSGNGYYTSPSLNLIIGNEYRLKITTSAGKQYISEYTKAQLTPPIDSITWRQQPEGVQLFANTSDAANATHYYMWNFIETWEYHAAHYSDLIVQSNGTIRPRVLPAESVYICWKSDSSKTVLIGNSLRLNIDRISEAPIHFVPLKEEKMSVRYSILVKQYALSKEAYAYYELLKKNTESLGSIFDPQPSEDKGNITCISDPSEKVIGYVTSSTVTEKRIFISNQELNDWRLFYFECVIDSVPKTNQRIQQALQLGELPFADLGPGLPYLFSLAPCVDCTVKGGTTTKPSFW